MVNNLKSKYDKEIVGNVLKNFGYLESVRPEEICVENFINIFKNLEK